MRETFETEKLTETIPVEVPLGRRRKGTAVTRAVGEETKEWEGRNGGEIGSELDRRSQVSVDPSLTDLDGSTGPSNRRSDSLPS